MHFFIDRKKGRRLGCLLTAVCLILALAFGGAADVYGAGQSTVYSVRVSGIYGQTEARKLAGLINELRTGKDAWYELMTPNSNGSSKKYVKNLRSLTYDYELEELAMLRAAELSLFFSDRRPDGTSYDTVFPDTYSGTGESIVLGGSSAKTVFATLEAENSRYAGQKDRREMLSAGYNVTACASFEADGVEYWVVLYGTRKSTETEKTRSFDDKSTIRVELSDSRFNEAAAADEELTVKKKSTVSLADPKLVLTMSVGNPYAGDSRTVVPQHFTLRSSNSKIVKVEGTKLTGVSAGTATVSLNALGTTVKIKVTVK